jgi:hypothetical protein
MHQAKAPGKKEGHRALQNYRSLVLLWLHAPFLAPIIWGRSVDFCKILRLKKEEASHVRRRGRRIIDNGVGGIGEKKKGRRQQKKEEEIG